MVNRGLAIAGSKSPQFRLIKALSEVFRRDCDYDIFWVAFRLVDKDKTPIFPADLRELELVVGIYKDEGRIRWQVPDSIRDRIKSLSRK